MGSSAGAHVAAWTALSHNAPWPDEQPRQVLPAAVMLVSPVTDTKAGGYGGPARFGDSPARALAASVTDHLNPGLAPTLVFHAVQDKTVPYANSEAFCAAMRAQQNRCDLVTFTEGGHTFYAQSQGGALALEKSTATCRPLSSRWVCGRCPSRAGLILHALCALWPAAT